MTAARKERYPQQKLAARLRDALDASKVSQVELARACRVTEQAVYDWLKTGRIGKQHFVAICHLTKKDLSYFFVGLKTWRRAAAIALPVLVFLPLALGSGISADNEKPDSSTERCVLCLIAKLLKRLNSLVKLSPFALQLRTA